MSIEKFVPNWMTEEHQMVYDSALKMFKSWETKDEEWRKNGMIDRAAWEEAGAMGFLCASIPEEYGGGGGDFGHEAALLYAQAEANQSGFGGMVHSRYCGPVYIGARY